jgi:protein kinase A
VQVILILEFLHTKNIIYRDLRPENLLFDHKGYLKLIDFSLAKVCDGKTYTICGTPEYMAPEIFLNKGYGFGVDWWAFGCFLYELLVGITPFFELDPILIYEKAIKGEVKFPSHVPPSAKSIIKHLLEKDVGKRYGCLSKGVNDIKNHRFFKDCDWNNISKQKAKAMYTPNLQSNDDMSLLTIITDEEESVQSINPDEDPFLEANRGK